ncbi:hypothetical protein GCM10010277_07870 [Streptomyces longisporoflavus]|nr:hypothetical protein GCM10010277_07870 [Streptomyces longisporoflavus]
MSVGAGGSSAEEPGNGTERKRDDRGDGSTDGSQHICNGLQHVGTSKRDLALSHHQLCTPARAVAYRVPLDRRQKHRDLREGVAGRRPAGGPLSAAPALR